MRSTWSSIFFRCHSASHHQNLSLVLQKARVQCPSPQQGPEACGACLAARTLWSSRSSQRRSSLSCIHGTLTPPLRTLPDARIAPAWPVCVAVRWLSSCPAAQLPQQQTRFGALRWGGAWLPAPCQDPRCTSKVVLFVLHCATSAPSVCPQCSVKQRTASARSRLARRSAASSSAGSRCTSEMYHPFSVSSTLQKPSRPMYLTKSAPKAVTR